MAVLPTHLIKRSNFASRNPGVILVFAIVGTVAIVTVGFVISKKLAARKVEREMRESKMAARSSEGLK